METELGVSPRAEPGAKAGAADLDLFERFFTPCALVGLALIFVGALSATVSQPFALIFMGLGGLCILIPAGLLTLWTSVVLGCFVAQTALERVIAIPRTLFLDAQFRITDLLLLVALLGNVEGLLLATVEDPVLGYLLCVLAGLWILAGATWGLWVATRLHVVHVRGRWTLIFLGVLFPLAAAGAPTGLTFILGGAGMGWEGWPLVLLGSILVPTCTYLACKAVVLHQKACGDTDTAVQAGLFNSRKTV